MKSKKGSEAVQHLSGVMTEEISGGVQRVSPIDGRKTGLKKKGVHYIFNSAKNTLSAAVLLGCVWARHS
jgi:hypothetical protein